MKRTTIVRIAEWTGWCSPCAADRPLVLTRTGRHTLRSWLVGSDSAERPLTLTCRLCGVGVVVPPEADDPEIVVSAGARAVAHTEAVVPAADVVPTETVVLADAVAAAAVAAPVVPLQVPAEAREEASPTVPVAHRPVPPALPAPDPAAIVPAVVGRAGTAPAAVVSAVAPLPAVPCPAAPVDALTALPSSAVQAAQQELATALGALLRRREDEAATTAAVLPQQRTGEAPAVDGLQALQLLAEGLDLLSTPR